MELQEKEFFMREALKEAQKAYDQAEVPIGAVVVLNGEIIGRGHNLREKEQDATLHAEIKAIRQANQHLGSWRLEDCELFVTLEPCPMCAGAILQARIPRLEMAIRNRKAGFCGSVLNILQMKELNHRVDIGEGLEAEEARALLKDFFLKLRLKEKGKRE